MTEDRLAQLEELMNWMTFKLEHLDHVFEFSTAAFKTQVDKGSDEFDSLVDDEHERLLALDDSVEAVVGGTIEKRVEALEKEFFQVFDAKVEDPVTGLEASVAARVDGDVRPFDDAWKVPFQLLLGAHAAFGIGVFLFMKGVKKLV